MINCASFFQGPTGVTGPKGARGAQGAPVSKTFISSNEESITQHQLLIQTIHIMLHKQYMSEFWTFIDSFLHSLIDSSFY